MDERDGKTYKTVQINNTIWLQDNLKFETDSSYFPNYTKRKSKLRNGNFYTNKVLDNLCPQGWEIPTEDDWEKYFQYRFTANDGDFQSIQIDSLQEEYLSLIYTDTTNTLRLLESENPLGLHQYGWVEGKKRKKLGTTTYWLAHSKIKDKRFHIHLGKKHYVIHRHKHHIEDVKENRRKFLVKCIKRIN